MLTRVQTFLKEKTIPSNHKEERAIYIRSKFLNHDNRNGTCESHVLHFYNVSHNMQKYERTYMSVPCNWGTHSYCAKTRVVIHNYALRS